jgi:hypothetical protein
LITVSRLILPTYTFVELLDNYWSVNLLFSSFSAPIGSDQHTFFSAR